MVAKPKKLLELDATIPQMAPPRDFTSLDYLMEVFSDAGIRLVMDEVTRIFPRQAALSHGTPRRRAADLSDNEFWDHSDDQVTRRIRKQREVSIDPLPEPVIVIKSCNLRDVSVTAPTERQFIVQAAGTDDNTKTSGAQAHLSRTPPSARRGLSPVKDAARQQEHHPLCQALLVLLTVFALFCVHGF